MGRDGRRHHRTPPRRRPRGRGGAADRECAGRADGRAGFLLRGRPSPRRPDRRATRWDPHLRRVRHRGAAQGLRRMRPGRLAHGDRRHHPHPRAAAGFEENRPGCRRHRPGRAFRRAPAGRARRWCERAGREAVGGPRCHRGAHDRHRLPRHPRSRHPRLGPQRRCRGRDRRDARRPFRAAGAGSAVADAAAAGQCHRGRGLTGRGDSRHRPRRLAAAARRAAAGRPASPFAGGGHGMQPRHLGEDPARPSGGDPRVRGPDDPLGRSTHQRRRQGA